jgi:SAM-dependent methyltransferase
MKEDRLAQTNGPYIQQQLPNPTSDRKEAVRVGNVTVIAQYDKKALEQQKQSFLDRSYKVSETPHFVVCQKRSSSQTVLMHTFGQSEIDADIICFIENELAQFGIVPSEKDFGALLFVILASTFSAPRNQVMIWRRFCLNTLIKLRYQVEHPPQTIPTVSYITPFATIYRRIFELQVGQSLLDVGCSFGFLPVLTAEREPNLVVIGCDNNPDAIGFSNDLASAAGIPRVTFYLKDLLDSTILCLGTFETVTALHVLEHIPEQEMPTALTHLFQMTSKRLIIAVPYEEHAQPLYGHHQVFTSAKLHYWGSWCIEALNGIKNFWVEDVAGGMLIVDRAHLSGSK